MRTGMPDDRGWNPLFEAARRHRCLRQKELSTYRPDSATFADLIHKARLLFQRNLWVFVVQTPASYLLPSKHLRLS